MNADSYNMVPSEASRLSAHLKTRHQDAVIYRKYENEIHVMHDVDGQYSHSDIYVIDSDGTLTAHVRSKSHHYLSVDSFIFDIGRGFVSRDQVVSEFNKSWADIESMMIIDDPRGPSPVNAAIDAVRFLEFVEHYITTLYCGLDIPSHLLEQSDSGNYSAACMSHPAW